MGPVASYIDYNYMFQVDQFLKDLKARFNDLISSSRVPKLGPFLISLPSIVQLQSLWVGQKSRLGPLKIDMPLKVSEWLPDDCPPYVSNSML